MKQPKFQIFKSPENEQFYFRLRAANGEIILASEAYTTRQNCRNGIASVKKNAGEASRFNRNKSKDGQYYFTLEAANGEIIGLSEMYTTAQARDHGMEAVQKAAPTAKIEDPHRV